MFLDRAKKLAVEYDMTLVSVGGKQLELHDKHGNLLDYLHQDQISGMDEDSFIEFYLDDQFVA